MSQRRNEMKLIWSLLVLYFGPVWSPVTCGALPNSHKKPTATIESQAKFFQDFFSVQLSPYKIEFGHVCEDPNTWEQRYEKKDYKNHRDMGKIDFKCLSLRLVRYRHLPTSEDFDQGHRLGSEDHFTERHERSRPSSGLYNAKVRWGDKKGGYGEHYWDLNHAGHNNDHDDGDYHSEGYVDDLDSYDEPSEQASHYEQDVLKEENERKKRAHVQKNKNLERVHREDFTREIYDTQNKDLKKQKRRSHERGNEREKNDIVLIVKQKVKEPEIESRKPKEFVPYDGDAAKDKKLETTTPSGPRLFFQPLTGHVIDRTTGQAFVLQPIVVNN